MLTSFDDYPLHQACVPVAHTATADLNHYDRYFFNGYQRDGELYFAAAMGLYPNRHVADAAFCVLRGGRQTSVMRSQRAPADRRDATSLGPAGRSAGFTLAFLDPPYGQGLAERALSSAAKDGWLAPGSIAIIEERKGATLELPADFEMLDQLAWGDTQAVFVRFAVAA